MTTEAPSSDLEIERQSRWRTYLTLENVVTSAVSIVVFIAVFLPLFWLVESSFEVLDDLGFDTEWGLGNYYEIFEGRVIRKAFRNPLLISAGTTVLATFLGVSLAWINARTNCPWRDRLEPFNLIPFFLSPFVGAIAWHNLAAPKVGFLNNIARWLFGIEGHILNVDNIYGVIWVTGIFFTPLVYLFVVGSLRRMDPSLEDSALYGNSELDIYAGYRNEVGKLSYDFGYARYYYHEPYSNCCGEFILSMGYAVTDQLSLGTRFALDPDTDVLNSRLTDSVR